MIATAFFGTWCLAHVTWVTSYNVAHCELRRAGLLRDHREPRAAHNGRKR